MNLVENIREGLRSIKANMLRSVLTAVIVAIGIMALVGILTTIDGIEYSVSDSLSSLGVNTFDIYTRVNRGGRQSGVKQRSYSSLQLKEVQQFINRYTFPASVSLNAVVTGTAEVKRLSKKSNPNILVMGVNTEYVPIKGLNIEFGRNLSTVETQYGTRVAVVGKKVVEAVFEKNENPVGQEVTVMGSQFRIIGVIKEKGNLSEDNYDNMVQIPILVANQMGAGRGLDYYLSVGVNDLSQIELAMGEATGLMRSIRHDQVGKENSFTLERSETLAETMQNLTGKIRVGGIAISSITLLGAAIALMNIMLVSVTERTREVGVRKALGATPVRIRQQFVIEAIVVCLLGGFAGIFLGFLVGNGLSSLMSIDAFILPWGSMMVGLIVCVGVGLVSGYYPAWKASKLDPIESLRFE